MRKTPLLIVVFFAFIPLLASSKTPISKFG